MKKKMTREEILEQAKQIVCTDREETYGEPENNFSLIAALWSTYISKELSPEDVAIMMALLKIARIKTGKYKADNYIDICGYVSCAGKLGGIYDR